MTQNKTESGFSVDGRIWLNIGGFSFTGQGRIELIEKIREFGSLRKAAADMKMSYRQAWQCIANMNKMAGKPLVILKRGGKNGGTAVITPFAEDLILTYRNLNLEFERFLNEKSSELHLT